MDKFLNLFIKTKSKDNDLESKNRKQSVITTQNLENFANISKSQSNNENLNNSKQIILDDDKVINFTKEDFENIDKIIIAKNEKVEDDKNKKMYDKISENNKSSIQQAEYNNKINNLNLKNILIPVGDVVMVNTLENIKKPIEGFYSMKYKEKFQALKSSNPILLDREKMRINFDKEVIDYLVNDMTYVFRERQYIIDSNQVKLIRKTNKVTLKIIGKNIEKLR